MKIGSRLAESRRNVGLSQADLALALGERYSQPMISQVERGHWNLLLDGAVKAAQVLDVSLDYLVGLADDPTPVDDRREDLEAALERTEAELERLRARVGQVATDGLTDEADPEAKPIPVHRLQSAAGSGAFELDETIKTYAYFRSEWLARKGLDAERCNIIGVMGESMEPTLPDGCVILLDRNRTRKLKGHIYVLRTEDGLVVKRAGKDEDGGWQLLSDHPEWKPQPWPYGAEVIGEVKWMAREW